MLICMMKRWLILTGVLAVTAVIATAAYLGYQKTQPAPNPQSLIPITVPVTQGNVQQTVTAPGQLVGIQEQVLGMDVGGRLVALTVRPGSVAQAGDLIARLDPAPFAEALAAAQIELAQAEAAYEQQLAEASLTITNTTALVGSTQAQIPSLIAAEVNLQQAIDNEARAQYEYQKALDRHWEPPEVQEAYRLEAHYASDARAIAQAEYDTARQQQWAVSRQIAAQQTDVERARLAAGFLQQSGVNPMLRLAVEQAQKALDATILTAPFDGVVLDVLVRPGESLFAGQAVVLLSDPTAGEVRATVIEEDLSLVQLGQMAEIYFDARPDIAVAGEVARIVPQRVAEEARPLYHVYLSLSTELPNTVLPGMTADASIVIDEAANVLRLPRGLVQARSDGTAVLQLWQNNQTISRDIQVGLRGDVYIEIVDGVEVGDAVIAE